MTVTHQPDLFVGLPSYLGVCFVVFMVLATVWP